MNFKEIIVLVGFLLAGGGTLGVYADNGELRGQVEVLTYRINLLEEQEVYCEMSIQELSDSLYELE